MADIYLVVIADRHSDTEVHAFTTESAAEVVARREALERWSWPSGQPIDRQELNDSMRADGWLYFSEYSTEGDYVRMQRVELRQ